MNQLQAIILGFVEGVTEFLPISSTFHLIFASKILGLQSTDFLKSFEVIIQSGAILAALVLFFQKLRNPKLLKMVLFSFIPTSLIGFILYKRIKSIFFENDVLQLTTFVMVGLIFLIYEKWISKKPAKKIDELSINDAIIIGLSQSLAIIPGVSRAGAVLLCGLFLGYRRDEAAEYSFMLAIPTIFAAGALDILKNYSAIIGYGSATSLLVSGTLTSFLSAFFVMRWFIGYLQKHNLSLFGWYRLALAAILILGI